MSNVEKKSRQDAHHLTLPMNDVEAAAFLGVAKQTMRNWRCTGIGPAYHKLTPGPRGRVIYRVEDLEAYMASCRVEPEAA